MVSELIESGYIFVLPEPDPQGRKVLFSVARKLDPQRHTTSHVVRAHIATFEVSLNKCSVKPFLPIKYQPNHHVMSEKCEQCIVSV